MGLFGKKKKKKGPLPPLQDPKWAQGEGGRFAKFLDLDPEAGGLMGVSAVYAIWHTGVQPGWVYIGTTRDLGQTFHEMGEDDEILQYAGRGNLYVSWCMIREEFQVGAAAYLIRLLGPKVDNMSIDPKDDSIDLIPIVPPGMTVEQAEQLAGAAKT